MKTKSNQILNTYEFIMKNNGENATDLYRRGDLFSLMDHAIVKRAVQSALSDDEQEVIILHFWSDLSLGEISKLLSVTSSEVSKIIEAAIKKIRVFCLGEINFSRTKFSQTSMAA